MNFLTTETYIHKIMMAKNAIIDKTQMILAQFSAIANQLYQVDELKNMVAINPIDAMTLAKFKDDFLFMLKNLKCDVAKINKKQSPQSVFQMENLRCDNQCIAGVFKLNKNQ